MPSFHKRQGRKAICRRKAGQLFLSTNRFQQKKTIFFATHVYFVLRAQNFQVHNDNRQFSFLYILLNETAVIIILHQAIMNISKAKIIIIIMLRSFCFSPQQCQTASVLSIVLQTETVTFITLALWTTHVLYIKSKRVLLLN